MNGTAYPPASYADIESAIYFIPPNLPREDWVKIGAALKSEGVDYELFNAWSSQGDGYSQKECQNQWRSFKPGIINIGTLFHYAKQHGYKPESTDEKPDYEAIAKRKTDAQAKVQQQVKTAMEQAKEAAKKCAQIYAMATPADDGHPYLVKKRVRAYGLKKDVAGNLVIPVFGADFNVISLQTISANGDKKFFYQAEINKGFFLIGDVYPDCEIYITEGYATGATIHELTGCPVYIAFTAGNLIAASQYVRSQYTGRDIIICSDNDHIDKQGNTRPPEKNTGIIAATKAANLINAQIRISQCAGTDFNDCFIELGRDATINQLFNVEKIKQPLPESEHFNVEHSERMLVDLSDFNQVNEFVESLISQINDNPNELQVIEFVSSVIANNTIGFNKTIADYIVNQLVKKEGLGTKKTVLKNGILAKVKIEKKELRKAIKQDCVPLSRTLVKESFPNIIETESGLVIIPQTENNLKHLLKSYGISAVYDEAIKSQELFIPGMIDIDHDLYNEAALQKIRSLAAMNNIKPSITDLIPIIMEENTVNPVKDWILSKEWDGKGRVVGLANTLIIKDETKNDLKNKILFTWLVQCVAALDRAKIGRQLNPKAKAKFELIFILQAKQGLTKTTWFNNLLPSEIDAEGKVYQFSNRYIKDGSNLALDNKDSIKQNISCWINELGELDSTFKKNEISMLKAFCSNQKDTLRLPFAKTDCKFQRSTSFCASVNDINFLNDTTGSRRMGVISLTAIIENHDVDMQQLWREIWENYINGEQWWLDKETEDAMQENNRLNHQSINPIEDAILGAFDWEKPKDFWNERYTATQIYQMCFDKKPNQKDLNAIKPILVELGVENYPSNGTTRYKLPNKIDNS